MRSAEPRPLPTLVALALGRSRGCHYAGRTLYDDVLDVSSDSGADSCIFGTGWQLMARYAHRAVNLVGYEPGTRKSRVPLVSACSLIADEAGNQLIGIVREGAWNPGSPTTLLSEFQLRDGGLLVDTVSHYHLRSETEHGTQCIKFLDDSKVVLPLRLVSGLMGLTFREPTQNEHDDLPHVELAPQIEWNPRQFCDDDDRFPLVEPLLSNACLASYHTRDPVLFDSGATTSVVNEGRLNALNVPSLDENMDVISTHDGVNDDDDHSIDGSEWS